MYVQKGLQNLQYKVGSVVACGIMDDLMHNVVKKGKHSVKKQSGTNNRSGKARKETVSGGGTRGRAA